MQDLFTSFTLSNPFVANTLFGFACLALGMLGMVLGQRVASQGKLCMILGIAVGVFNMWLLTTSFAVLAPGLGGVFVVSFLASNAMMKLCTVGGGAAPAAAKKLSAPPAPPAGGAGQPPRQ